MRIATVYHPRLHTGCGKFHFVADAFRALGHDVSHVQTLAELSAADRVCDLVLFEQRNPATICDVDLLEFLPEMQAVRGQWYFDLNAFDDTVPLENQAAIAPYLGLMRQMDVVFVKERDRLHDYQDIGINAAWLDQGCPSTIRQAVLQESPEFDVVLWGSAARPLWKQRWSDVDCLCRMGFKVGWFSDHGEPLPTGCNRRQGCQPLQLPEVIEQGKVSLCVDARQDIDGYWSDRIWLASGAGACVIRRASGGDDDLPAVHYRTESELIETVKTYCGDFWKRSHQGRFARHMTVAGHLYEHGCQRIIEHAENVISKRHEKSDLPALQGV